jgi:riboflavin kinase / FMN adenylyltransferase
MKIYRGVSQLPHSIHQSVVAIGNFDGLHLGHQALVERTLEISRAEALTSVALTFSPHPLQVLHPERVFESLNTREWLAEQLIKKGIEVVVVEPFTKEFSQNSPRDFVHKFLVSPLKPRAIVVGKDFAFGSDRSGSLESLKQLGQEMNFRVENLLPVMCDGEVISSSKIRRDIKAGDVDRAHRCLGRPYFLEGIVEQGAGRGKGLGYPTANLSPKGFVIPRVGVYATMSEVSGMSYLSVTNVGTAPTFNSDESPIKVETHILGQELSLSGLAIKVFFLERLRDEVKFASADELKAQIKKDVERARAVWAKKNEMGGHRI